MKKLLLAAWCAFAFTGCAEMPQHDQQAQQVSASDEEPMTGTFIKRRKPLAPAAAQAGETAPSSAQQ